MRWRRRQRSGTNVARDIPILSRLPPPRSPRDVQRDSQFSFEGSAFQEDLPGKRTQQGSVKYLKTELLKNLEKAWKTKVFITVDFDLILNYLLY